VRLSIRSKLFIAFLTATAIVAAVMYGFMHWSFHHGFVSFLESRQQARAERIAERLAEEFRADSGWQALRGDKMLWWRLMADTREALGPGMGPGMGLGYGHGMGRGDGPRGFEFGYVLLDVDKTLIAGRQADLAKLQMTPIRVDGKDVGYIGRPLGRALSEVLDLRFAEQQSRAFIWIALLVGLLAAALSWPLANMLVRPVRRVADAARDLAAGRFQARVPAGSHDELGDLARDFNAMAMMLERTEGARRQWMADISHELRTPLALLRAELEALQDGVRPLDAEAVASLQADVERLNRLVDDLYQLSMTDLGAMSYRKRNVAPAALLRDDVEALAPEFERHGLTVALRDMPRPDLTLHADPDRLSQLFRNLLLNSLRYTDSGGRLEIRVSGDNDRFILDFQDSAPAVPRDEIGKLFDRFYRVEASRSREHGGAGLGLAICRNIVEAHGGSIEARPSPLGGLCIHVELPLHGPQA
jgi:two-component system sensor histidine kinase BaeS